MATKMGLLILMAVILLCYKSAAGLVCRPDSECCPKSKFCEAGKFCTACDRSAHPYCRCSGPSSDCRAESQCCSDQDCPHGSSCSICTKSIPPICRCTGVYLDADN
uniref:Bowman-Birk inhibitor 1 n=1 Tax=Isoetes drummondii TaxID=358750 RepID=A0A1V0PLJ6_9TRAC|nr:Bowman-Birk inhibitor 1 [Isoetes drummondii]